MDLLLSANALVLDICHCCPRERPGRVWRPGRGALGTVAGSLSLGCGRFVALLDHHNDGTVAASEATDGSPPN